MGGVNVERWIGPVGPDGGADDLNIRPLKACATGAITVLTEVSDFAVNS